ncbi:MAG: alpha/beta hydrolase [Tatlockia sp.]|jgi:hypothetical protein
MLKPVLFVSSLLLCFIVLLFYVFQRHLIYFPEHESPKLQDYHATDMTLVTLQTKDNLVLTSWYKPAINNQPTLLFLHGNAGHIGYRMPLVRQFINAGFGVFLLEYRGYGGNRGVPTEHGLYEDGRTALQFLYQKGAESIHVVLYGESLGTGIATKLAVEYPVCAVILQSPFTSLVSLSRHHYPWLIIKPWDQFNSLERIKQIHVPLLVLHGKQDQIVPFNEGLTLFNQANEPKKMLVFADQNHNDLWSASGFSEEIIHFVQTHCHK